LRGKQAGPLSKDLDSDPARPADHILSVRKAPHAQVWSVWAALEGTNAEETFEGSSEQEALDWIATGGQTWLEERSAGMPDPRKRPHIGAA
jgi:hypothetical protein